MQSASEITWEILLTAYANGYFPMAENKDDPHLHWFYPKMRGVIPLDGFHVPTSLAKFMKKSPFIFTINKAFPDVIHACAELNAKRDNTWINEKIITLYCELHMRGFAHSVEVWSSDKMHSNGNFMLVGGLYGVAIGGAFFGESMFSRTSNASKCALVHLVELLKKSGYILLDTQFTNDHLKQFGVIEIPREHYIKQLEAALKIIPAAIC